MKKVGTMKIGDKDYPIAFNLNQSIEYCELRGITINEMNEELSKLTSDSGAIMRDLMWSSMKEGARKTKKEFNLTNYDVGDLLEDLTEEGVAGFLQVLTDTLPKPTESDNKKKVTRLKK